MKNLSVFCGSSSGTDPLLIDTARQLGVHLASSRIGLIYGGARVGLMGAVADGALSAGGEVTGVLPSFLRDKEIAHSGLTRLISVESMHERKRIMHEMSDGVIALPGGFGTLEEYFEMLTWGQLGLHRQPVALLNIGGFFDSLLHFADTMVAAGLLKEVNRKMMLEADTIEGLMEKMLTYEAPSVGKWMSPSDT